MTMGKRPGSCLGQEGSDVLRLLLLKHMPRADKGLAVQRRSGWLAASVVSSALQPPLVLHSSLPYQSQAAHLPSPMPPLCIR